MVDTMAPGFMAGIESEHTSKTFRVTLKNTRFSDTIYGGSHQLENVAHMPHEPHFQAGERHRTSCKKSLIFLVIR